MHMIITICTSFSVWGAFLKNLLQFFVQVYSFCCEWENNSVETNDDDAV